MKGKTQYILFNDWSSCTIREGGIPEWYYKDHMISKELFQQFCSLGKIENLFLHGNEDSFIQRSK
jgi:hypothetical protein